MTVLDPLVPTSTGFRVFPSNVRGTIFSAFNPGNTPSPNQNNKSKRAFLRRHFAALSTAWSSLLMIGLTRRIPTVVGIPYKLLRDSSLRKSPTYQSASPVGFAYKLIFD